jgi:hypothetical protein
MDYLAIAVVFIFMLALVGSASYGAYIYARWQNDETERQIMRGFDALKRQLKEGRQ